MLPQGRREYSLQRSLMKVTGSDLMKLLRMITTLSIIHNPTFWVAHDAYLSSRFKLLQVLEKYTLLGAIVRQYERSKPGITINVKAYRDRKAKLRFAATYWDKEPLIGSDPVSSPSRDDLQLQLMGVRAYSVCVQIIFCAAYTRRFVRSESHLSSCKAHFDNIIESFCSTLRRF